MILWPESGKTVINVTTGRLDKKDNIRKESSLKKKKKHSDYVDVQFDTYVKVVIPFFYSFFHFSDVLYVVLKTS